LLYAIGVIIVYIFWSDASFVWLLIVMFDVHLNGKINVIVSLVWSVGLELGGGEFDQVDSFYLDTCTRNKG